MHLLVNNSVDLRSPSSSTVNVRVDPHVGYRREMSATEISSKIAHTALERKVYYEA
jgi:hypothetical protein